jgi:hypothetical protein
VTRRSPRSAATSAATTSADQPDTDFIDEIAVQRCVAGTLAGGTGMNSAEKEHAVLILHQRGYPNPEITRRAGVSVAEIGQILRRHGRRPRTRRTKSYRPAVPIGCTATQAHRARLLVVSQVRDQPDAFTVLSALGLVAAVTSDIGEAAP